MANIIMNIHAQVLDAFRRGDSKVAWELVCEHIGGKDGMTIPDSALTVDCVPTQWRWRHPSAAQAFALTYYGDEMKSKGGPDGCALYEQVSEKERLDHLASFSLTELRAVLYFVQRAARWNESDPEPNLVRRLLTEIRKRLKASLTMNENPIGLLLKATQFAAEKHRNQRRKDAEACLAYGLMVLSGKGTPKDPAEGFAWMLTARNLGLDPFMEVIILVQEPQLTPSQRAEATQRAATLLPTLGS